MSEQVRGSCTIAWTSNGAYTTNTNNDIQTLISVGDSFGANSAISASQNGNTVLRFDDASLLVLAPASTVLFKSFSRESPFFQRGIIDVELLAGRIMFQPSPFGVHVKVALGGATVEGERQFQLSRDGGTTALYSQSGGIKVLTNTDTTEIDEQLYAMIDGTSVKVTRTAPASLSSPLYPWPASDKRGSSNYPPNVRVKTSYKNGQYTLDASGSTDPDGDPILRYWWVLLDGPIGAAKSLTLPQLTFTARTGFVKVRAFVDDGNLSSYYDVTLPTHTEAANTPPVADFECPLVFSTDFVAQLNAFKSTDPDGDPLTFSWSVTPAEVSSLSTVEGVSTTLSSTHPGNYAVVLTVTDLYGAKTSVSKVLRIVTKNHCPTATANMPYSIPAGMPLLLSSSFNDKEGANCVSLWSLLESPDTEVYSRFPQKGDTKIRLFTAGEYKFALQVTDGENTTDTIRAVLYVLPNSSPPQIIYKPCVARMGKSAFVDITDSYDGNAAPLTLSIRYVSGPVCALSFVSQGRVEFTPRFPGCYRFSVTASAISGTTDGTVDIVVPRENSAPSASISGPAMCSVREKVTFTAMNAIDQDDDPLSFAWTATSSPNFKIESTGSEFSFAPPHEGTYSVSLVVSDGILTSTTAIFALSAIKALNHPVAKAIVSPDSPQSHAPVILSAAASQSAQGGLLSFLWFQTSGPPVELKGTESVICTFVPQYASRYEFLLTVNETHGLSASKSFQVQVASGNSPPVAIAPSRIHVRLGETLLLSGSLSYDPDGDEITGKWIHIGGAKILPSKSRLEKLSVTTTPESSGTARFQLSVSDGMATSLAEVEVICFDATQELTAIDPVSATLSQGAGLNVSVLNPLPDTSYRWFQLRGVRVSFDESGPQTKISFPFSGVYEFGVVATSGVTTIPAAYCTVLVMPTMGIPIVHLFGPSAAKTGQKLALEAAVTGNLKGDVEYEWRQVTGPITDVTKARKDGSLINLIPKEPGLYEFEVSAVSGKLRSAIERLRITVTSAIPPPRADAGPDQFAEVNVNFSLDASNSRQAGGGSLTYTWRQISGATSLFADELTGRIITLQSASAGVYTFALTVNNGAVTATDEAVVRIKARNLPPTVSISAASTIEIGDLLVLDASSSTDPDGDPLRYTIRQVRGIPLPLPSVPRDLPYFVLLPPQTGEYEFVLLAEDGISGITSASHIVNVREPEATLMPSPGIVQSDTLLDLPEALRIVSDACGRDLLPTTQMLNAFRKDGPLEKRIGPLNWTAPRENLPALLAFELSALYRDLLQIEARRGPNIIKNDNPNQILFSRDYSFLADEPADVRVYSYPGATSEQMIDSAVLFLRAFLASSLADYGFSVSRRDMQIVVHMPGTGHLRLRDLISLASAPRPAMPTIFANSHFFPNAANSLIFIPESAQNLRDILNAASEQSAAPALYCDSWLEDTAAKTAITQELRLSLVGWIPRNSLLQILGAAYPWLVWTLESTGDIRVTLSDRRLLERSGENVWDCGSIAVFVPPAPLLNTPFGSTIDFIRNSSPVLSALWTPHDNAVFMGYDPRGRLVLCNSPRALAYTIEVLWKTIESSTR